MSTSIFEVRNKQVGEKRPPDLKKAAQKGVNPHCPLLFTLSQGWPQHNHRASAHNHGAGIWSRGEKLSLCLPPSVNPPTGKAQAFINWAFSLVSIRKPLSTALRGFTAEQVKGSQRSRSPDKSQGPSHGLKEGNGKLPASHTTVGRQDQS